jgi:hypothetical protein
VSTVALTIPKWGGGGEERERERDVKKEDKQKRMKEEAKGKRKRKDKGWDGLCTYSIISLSSLFLSLFSFTTPHIHLLS